MAKEAIPILYMSDFLAAVGKDEVILLFPIIPIQNVFGVFVAFENDEAGNTINTITLHETGNPVILFHQVILSLSGHLSAEISGYPPGVLS